MKLHFDFVERIQSTAAKSDFNIHWCYENFIQYRLMKKARDVREQLVDLMQRVEMELVSGIMESINIRKNNKYHHLFSFF